MNSFWRLLKGVWPYRFWLVVSFLCAIGVSLSYASGVATLYPVLKIFISTEGVHGWANQRVADGRLGVQTLNLGDTATRGSLAINLMKVLPSAPASLQKLAFGDQITRVQMQSAHGLLLGHSHDWLGMMALLAHARAGQMARMTIVLKHNPKPATMAIVLPPRSIPMRYFSRLVNVLPPGRFMGMCWITGMFILLCIVGSAFRYFQTYLSAVITARVIIDLRRRLFSRMINLPLAYTAGHGTNDLASRLTIDTNTLADGLGSVLGKAILEPTKSIGVAVVAILIDWRLFIGTLVVLPIMGVIIGYFGKRMKKASTRSLQGWSQVVAISNESLNNVRVVKAYSGGGYERRRFERANRHLLRMIKRGIHYNSLSRPVFETLSIVLISIPLLIMFHLVLGGTISKDSFLVMLACMGAIFEPLRKLNDLNNRVQVANAAAARCFEILDLPTEESPGNLPKLPRHAGSVDFQQVGFHYPNRDRMVLEDINLHVEHGRFIAIVGANGSGKSTLLSLLTRFYEPTSGRVLIDGTDIKTVSLASLRRQIGLVTQDTMLFSDTVYNNIAYGQRHADRERILDAARRSYVDDFVRDLPQGYDTQVGQGGAMLSGGQRQRIAIARAILRDPAILILDEALSQADSESEAKISLALAEFVKTRTTFVIAHHFNTVVSADRIICLENGRIVGAGRHSELLTGCPPYRRLYETQLMGRPETADSSPRLPLV